jgi:hypothetical protein
MDTLTIEKVGLKGWIWNFAKIVPVKDIPTLMTTY